MVKKIFSFILLVLFSSHLVAKTRTTQEILSLAQQAINQKTAYSKVKSVKNSAKLSILRKESQLTLVGDERQRCVIISNDDAIKPVLGYTDAPMGENVAPGFLWWVQTINASLEIMLSDDAQPVTVERNAAYQVAVPELLTTKWGQDLPYNKLCPEYTEKGVSTHYVTGCVATAMAQIMNYHKYPLQGAGRYSYRYNPGDGATLTLVADFKNTTYDWDNMLDEYVAGTYNEVQANAVATLMYHCGVSVKMNYTKDGSGAYTADACRALRKYFVYNSNIKCYDRRFFPVDEWMQIIYREINDKCPVLYGGQSSAGGHEFVFDGYDEDGLVHVNWGWNGSEDGYFDIASLNGFSSGQQMVVVRPATDDRFTEPYKSLWGLNGDLTITKFADNLTVKTGTLYNLDVDDFVGAVSLVAKDMNDQSIKVLDYVYDSTDKFPYLNGFTYNDFKVNVKSLSDGSSLPDGQYRLFLATKSINEDEWQPVRSYESTRNSYILTMKNGAISALTAEKTSNWTAAISQVSTTASQSSPYTYIYNVQGQEIYKAPTASFRLIDVPAHGILIVKQGNVVKKIVK